MTQKIFDTDNADNMALLWSILPDDVYKIKKEEHNRFNALMYFLDGHSIRPYLILNWHDKREITRPIQEATEDDVGKLCVFWNDEFKGYGILTLKDVAGGKPYYIADSNSTYDHCRRLTKQEIEELC